MKQQKKFWFRLIDGFLPKNQQKLSVIERYRSRAMVRTGLLAALLNPFLFLFESSVWNPWQRAGIAFALIIIPILVVYLYHRSARLRLCCCLYLLYCTSLCAWAQVSSQTIHALYWLWIPFLIVYCVLVLGVKPGAVYTGLASLLFWLVFQDNRVHGFTFGSFSGEHGLLSSLAVQLVLVQLSFLLLMITYDAVRNRAEVRAVLLRFTDEEAARLATVGERMGGMAQELNTQLDQFQGQLALLEGLAKRSDTKVEDLQKIVSELQEQTQKMSEISHTVNS